MERAFGAAAVANGLDMSSPDRYPSPNPMPHRSALNSGFPCGLRSLPGLKADVKRDLRRAGAAIALNKSMESWIVKQAPTPRGATRPATGGAMTAQPPQLASQAAARRAGDPPADAPGEEPQSPGRRRSLVKDESGNMRRSSIMERRASQACEAATEVDDLGDEPPGSPVGKRRSSGASEVTRRSSIPSARRISRQELTADDIIGLEDAFEAHAKAFDLDGDGTISVEELITIFARCHLFDANFTPNKVRDYFKTWMSGCNHYHGRSMPENQDEIGFKEFKDVLQWGSDIKRADFDDSVMKVVRLSKRLCDKEASVQHRLEVVFDSFSKRHPQYMTAFEFGHLARKLDVNLSMGDIFSFFSQLPGGVQGKGVDFAGFLEILTHVGERLGLGEEAFATFARAVELLDTDEATINKVKMRLRQAVAVISGSGADWKKFFHECDPDGSGCIDWDEFLDMCRTKLHLADRDNHLRLLFEKLDEDGSDELEIDELVNFVATD